MAFNVPFLRDRWLSSESSRYQAAESRRKRMFRVPFRLDSDDARYCHILVNNGIDKFAKGGVPVIFQSESVVFINLHVQPRNKYQVQRDVQSP